MDNYFIKLNEINCNDKTEQKNGLTYLSWAYAWGEVKKLFPEATFTIYENPNLGGMPYFTDGRTCMVKTGVTINGIEHIEYLPVMDYRNASIPADKVTSFDINKAIQRSLTKAVARHGLGLYIYAGEDLPEVETKAKTETKAEPEAEGYKPMDENTYWGIIREYALGHATKTGGDYMDTWKEVTHADAKAIAKFKKDVKNYKTANNLK